MSPNDPSDRETAIVPVDLGDGTRILIEVTTLGGREKVSELKPLPIKEVMATIETVSKLLGQSLTRIGPSKASVEFGVEVSLETGALTALICKGGGKANLKITLEWSRRGEEKPQLKDQL
jgi:hypothetical protein